MNDTVQQKLFFIRFSARFLKENLMNIHMTTLACPYCERGHLTLNSGMATFLPYINRLNSNKITSDNYE